MAQEIVSTFEDYYLRTKLKANAQALQVSDVMLKRLLEVIKHHERNLQNINSRE
jgi:hypothetical protein